VLIPGFDLIKNGYGKRCVRFWNIRIWAFYFRFKGRDTADKVAKAMSTVYDEMKLPYEIHVSKVNPDGIRIL
jgi:homoserine kinase